MADITVILNRNRHQRVVEDGNLDVQIHAIRKLLGKQALVTVPGRGYRFALGSSDPAAVVVETETSRFHLAKSRHFQPDSSAATMT